MTLEVELEAPDRKPAKSHGSRLGALGQLLGLISKSEAYALPIAVGLVALLFTVTEGSLFASPESLRVLLVQQSIPTAVALAVLVAAVVGQFDLSVGYTVGTASVLTMKLVEGSVNPTLAVLAGIALGVAVGLLNGYLVAVLEVPSLIATLGTGLALSGVGQGLSGGATLVKNVPDVLSGTAESGPLQLPYTVWIVIGLAVVIHYVLQYTPLGRRLYATGTAPIAARLAGVKTTRSIICVMGASGLLAGLASQLQLGYSGAANPSFGVNLLLPAFAVVFLGATSIHPGLVNIPGALFAILLLSLAFTGLNLAGSPYWVEPTFDGVVLVSAVVLSRVLRRKIVSR